MQLHHKNCVSDQFSNAFHGFYPMTVLMFIAYYYFFSPMWELTVLAWLRRFQQLHAKNLLKGILLNATCNNT